MAILVAGTVDIFANGRFVGGFSGCGFHFGETALLEEGSLRTATVRAGLRADPVFLLYIYYLFI